MSIEEIEKQIEEEEEDEDDPIWNDIDVEKLKVDVPKPETIEKSKIQEHA